MVYPIPANEGARLQSLRRLKLIEETISPELNAAVELAAVLFDCPFAVITVLDSEKQWFKAKYGLSVDCTDREYAFCNYTIERGGLFVVEDTLDDERFTDNPYVFGPPGVRFYAGSPLMIDGQHALGAFCILDKRPRKLSEKEQQQFLRLAEMVCGLIRNYDSTRKIENALQLAKERETELERHAALLEKVTNVSGVGGWELRLGEDAPVWTKQTRLIHEVDDEYVPLLSEAIDFYAPEARPIIEEAIDKGVNEGVGWDLELPLITKKGRRIWARAIGEPIYSGIEITGLIGTFQDISEVKANEERYRLSQELAQERSEELDVTLANMKQGVSMFDADGKLMIWNDKYVEIFEKPADEVIKGKPFKEILIAEQARGDFTGDVEQSIAELCSELANGKTVARQFELQNGRIISSVHAPMPGGGWVGTHEDVTDQIKASKEMEFAARHDPLTGLANRLSFNSSIADAVENRRKRSQRPAVLLIDLDGFKLVNDIYGHQAGDELLKGVAERLSAGIRPMDLAARLGGDEFALIVNCEEPAYVNLQSIAKRILNDFDRPFAIDGKSIKVGVSIGISFIEDVRDPVESAICNADNALYKVKGEGKNNFCIFDLQVNMEITERRLREIALEDVVKKRAFELHYQPVQMLCNDTVSGYEALIRWNSNEHKQQNPAEFIPLAEELGLIEDIGNWVIDTAIREASGWIGQAKLAINISPQQLGKMNVYLHVAKALDEHSFPPDQLELEITEYAILQDNGATVEELDRLRELGVGIVLDDFGTGYSSLSYLHRFTFSKIKIDRSFIQGFQNDKRRACIIEAIATLAMNLGIDVTAEGVETSEQLRLIKAMGCNSAQGYFLGKPKPMAHWFGGSGPDFSDQQVCSIA